MQPSVGCTAIITGNPEFAVGPAIINEGPPANDFRLQAACGG
jgi:hypothetical protein